MIIWLLTLGVQHWLFDWALQSRWMAENKSKRWDALLAHVAVVTTGLLLTGIAWWGTAAATWALLNGVLHFTTDAVTSRITARLYAAKRDHAFFTVIGADQWLLHYPMLIISSALLLGVPPP